MKAVLMSIQPKWCELIASRKKTVEVRKTKPKLAPPFKVYIYCTKDNTFAEKTLRGFDDNGKAIYYKANKGKVIGEFVCDRIDDFFCASVPYVVKNNMGYGKFIDNGVYKVQGNHEGIVFERNDRYIDTMLKNSDLEEMCLSAQEVYDYIGLGNHLYAWHISDLVIYDEPRELGEFKTFCKSYYEGNKCDDCKYFIDGRGYEYDESDCGCNGLKPITRPPQSWCYCEEVER